MAATRVSLTANIWVQVTNGEAEGLISHQLGTKKVVYTIAESSPTGFDESTPVVSATTKGEALSFSGVKGGEFIFAFCIDGDADLTVSDSEGAATLIKTLSTGSGETGRVKTDDQPTSYEENRQFKIFHRFNGVAGNEQIVYWFKNVNPVNIKERTIRLKEGKREYLVIPDPQDGTYDSILAQLSAAETPVRIVNSNLEDSGLPSHPVSSVTVLHGVGANLFTVAGDDQFPNGDLVGVGAQGNNALNPNSGVDSNLSGVEADSAFFLVQIPYENEVTSGQFFLLWEEIF